MVKIKIRQLLYYIFFLAFLLAVFYRAYTTGDLVIKSIYLSATMIGLMMLYLISYLKESLEDKIEGLKGEKK